MKKLLHKEFRLTASPLSYWFLAFSLMTMIPGYPILVGAFFLCLGLFYTFQSAREQNDVLYTVLLPIRKRDVVRARFAFCITLQMICFALCTALTLLRMTVLSDALPYVQNPMMNANLAYLGDCLMIYGLFNLCFVRSFFSTAYRIGRPFIVFAIAAFVVIALGETLHHLPGLQALNAQDFSGLTLQCIPLAAGLLFYLIATPLASHFAQARFEALDL